MYQPTARDHRPRRYPRPDVATTGPPRTRSSTRRTYCHLGFVVDGEPRVLPTLHVRIGDTLYLHGSTGSRPLLAARGDGGLPVCVAVTLLDGLVYARSQFHHSANYRSVVAHGTARLVTDERREARGADRAGGEGRRRAGPPTAGRRPHASWPRPPCWRCRCARCR